MIRKNFFYRWFNIKFMTGNNITSLAQTRNGSGTYLQKVEFHKVPSQGLVALWFSFFQRFFFYFLSVHPFLAINLFISLFFTFFSQKPVDFLIFHLFSANNLNFTEFPEFNKVPRYCGT